MIVVTVTVSVIAISVLISNTLLFHFRRRPQIRERGSLAILLLQNTLLLTCLIGLGIDVVVPSVCSLTGTIVGLHANELNLIFITRCVVLLFRIRITRKIVFEESQPDSSHGRAIRRLFSGQDSWFVRKRRIIMPRQLAALFISGSILLALPLILLNLQSLQPNCTIRTNSVFYYCISTMLAGAAASIIFFMLLRNDFVDTFGIRQELRNCAAIILAACIVCAVELPIINTPLNTYLIAFVVLMILWCAVTVQPLRFTLWALAAEQQLRNGLKLGGLGSAGAPIAGSTIVSSENILKISLNQFNKDSIGRITEAMIESPSVALIETLLYTQDGNESLLDYTHGEFTPENVLFWNRVRQFKTKFARQAESVTGKNTRSAREMKQFIDDVVRLYLNLPPPFKSNLSYEVQPNYHGLGNRMWKARQT